MNKLTLFRLLCSFWIIFALSGCGYNDIQSDDENVNATWAEVLNQYQRRADLVPNLVASVKGYAAHESEVFAQIAEARAKIGGLPNMQQAPQDEQSIKQFQQAQASMSSALSRLLVVNEKYPDLKSDQLYTNLMVQLEGTENRIAVARHRYVQAVQTYNTRIRTFPNNLTASWKGYNPKLTFQPENIESISTAPKIDFSTPSTAK